MAIEQMRSANKHTYQPQMKYLTISVALCKQMRIYANYHIFCIGFTRERPLENGTYLIYAYSYSLNVQWDWF